MKWRPIKSAPRDGTLILLAAHVGYADPPAWNVMMGKWIEAFREWPQYGVVGLTKLDERYTRGWVVCYPATYSGSGNRPSTWMPSMLPAFYPSHWMPMPKPPVKPPRP